MLEKLCPSSLSPATVWRELFNNMELTYNLPEGHQSGEPDNTAVDPECRHSALAKPLTAFFIAAKCKWIMLRPFYLPSDFIHIDS